MGAKAGQWLRFGRIKGRSSLGWSWWKGQWLTCSDRVSVGSSDEELGVVLLFWCV